MYKLEYFRTYPHKVSILGDTPQRIIAYSIPPRLGGKGHSLANICKSSSPIGDPAVFSYFEMNVYAH